MSGVFDQQFYNQTIRKYTAAFGSMFANMQIIKYSSGGVELERIGVPLVYAQREKFYTRTKTDPDLTRSVQVNLPRMSIELTGVAYDSSRKQSGLIANRSPNGANKQYMGVPYDLQFQLSIYVRNIEDGTQIIEQILPIFNPDYTLTIDLIDSMQIFKDIPITLQGVNYTNSDEGPGEDLRLITWEMTFIMKGWLFPRATTAALITKANTYFYDDTKQRPPITVLVLDNTGFGTYKRDEYIYQGDSLNDATSLGQVVEYDSVNHKLYITNQTRNPFITGTNNYIVGSDSGASFNLNSYYMSTTAVAMTYIHPNPITANANSNWTYVIQTKEWPKIP